MSTMSAMKALILSFSAVSILVVSGCAARTPVAKVDIETVKANLKYRNVLLRQFKAAPEVAHPDAALLECRRSTIDYLRMKGVFKTVDAETGKQLDGPTMYVDVTLTDLRIVSSTARIWGGAMAGRSHMKIIATLTDASNGSKVAEQELLGVPGAYGAAWSAGHSDRDLPTKMGLLLGDFILANVSEKR